MTVPEGFFEDFVAKMEAMLPERPEAEQPRRIEHRTTWQRVRPYVYMAAMFAGIWCMLEMYNDSISVEDFTPVDSLVDTETVQAE